MIRFIKRLHKKWKRARRLRDAWPRLAELRPSIETACGGPVRFLPGDGGGHDYIFYVQNAGGRIAVLRIANPAYIPEGTPTEARFNGPRLRLTPRERVLREWRICRAGAPHGLTPKPLWISPQGDAALNAYVSGSRLSDWVRQGRLPLWDAIDLTARRANAFHAAVGEAHMDLTLMNIFADASLAPLTLIDFELGPHPALSLAEARLFDFLNLVEMAYKFMSPADKAAAPERLGRLFSDIVPGEVRQAPVARLAAKLPRILADPVFRDSLAHLLNMESAPCRP